MLKRVARTAAVSAAHRLRFTHVTAQDRAQRGVHFPVTKAIYVLFERLGDGRYIASAMGVWAMALLGVTLVGATMLLGKRLGAMLGV